MKPLQDVIEAIRRELPEGLSHASVTLQCVVIEKGGSISVGVVTSADLPGMTTHAVTVSLAARSSSQQFAETTTPPMPVAHGSDELRPLLERMFGIPGFDNAARASVFCEIVEGLEPAQLGALLQNLREDKTEVPLQKHPDAAVAMARTRLLRVLKLGPAGLAGGIDAALTAFEKRSASAVLETIRAIWKTQSDWIDTTPPGIRLE